MPIRLSPQFAGAAIAAIICSVSLEAHAGFQWVAPPSDVPAPVVMTQQAPITTTPEIISPVVITGSQQPRALIPAPSQVAVAPSPVATAQPMMLASPAPQSQPVFASAAPLPLSSTDDTPVVGFANSVPLAIALRQVIPSGHAFAIDPNIDMGTPVSFQGGRGWRETLRDALAPVGLVMHESGQMVTVSAAAADIMPAAPTVVARMPQPAYQMGMEPRALVAPAPMAMAPGPVVAPLPAPQAIMPAPAMALSVPAPAMTVTTPASVSESWTADRGDMLRKVLEIWCRRSNVEFDWLSEYDYPLEASVAYSGTFESAVRNLLTGFENAHPQPVAELHSNAGLGQMVLVIQARGNTNTD